MFIQVRQFNEHIKDDAGLCHRLSRRGYGVDKGGPKGEPLGSAWDAWLFSKTQHEDRNFPTNVAVPLWFSHYGTYGSPAKYGNWGHVAVRLPGVKTVIVSSPGSGHGQKRFSSIEALEKYFNAKYVGWTEDINGRPVIKKDTTKPAAPKPKTVAQLAQEVWDGLHGDGEARKKSLGKQYAAVQKEVNRIAEQRRLEKLAKLVWEGLYGNGAERKRNLGKDYAKVQAIVNKGKRA